ncbi:cell surface protein [Enhygromyxa salina]|uniref:Cell surface protein n=1 Tax=Enhygromyxa salina TaxID=215803 RepID=A0A0C2DD98_9BACT|nr:nucleotide-binding protein [Enhygromyxa salina]KIG17672.1 cell surface protein [Enhygromyxa salina]
MGDTGESDTQSIPSETDTGEPLECDIPQLFVDRCGGSICHSAGESTAASLDLTSPGVEDRVSGVPGASCAGILANPAFPEDSLLYLKVNPSPTCGSRMPIGGQVLNDDEISCLRDWISGLLPPDPTDTDTDTDTNSDDTMGGCPECVCEPGEVEACYDGPDDTADVGICVSGSQTCADDGLSWGPCEGAITPQSEDCYTDDLDENCDGLTPPCSEQWSQSFGNELSQTLASVAVDSSGDIYAVGDFEGAVSFGDAPLVATGDKADIVIAKYDLYGNPLWSKRFGDSSNQYSAKIIVDSEDNLIYVGRIYGHVDFGGGELTGEGAADVVIAKLDSDGNHIWSRSYGDLDPDRAERVAVDSQDNVLLTGTFTGEVDYGSGMFASAGMRDAFVLKLNGNNGAHVFSLQIGGPGDDYGFGIDADANNNVVIAGRFQDSIPFDGGLNSAGGRDIYLAKLTPLGAVLWSDSFGGPGEDGVHDLKVNDQTGDIVMVGFMSNSMNFGGPNLVSAGLRDIFLTTIDQNGGHVWSKRFGDATDQFTNNYELNTWMSLALAANGDIYMAGALLGSASFGGAIISSSGVNPDVFYAHFNASGDLVANNRYGSNGTDIGLDIAVTDSGRIVMAGRSFAGSLDFGLSGAVQNQGVDDGFLVKLQP